MGSSSDYWITDPSWSNGNVDANIYYQSGSGSATYHIYLGSASIYDYKYIRCVKD